METTSQTPRTDAQELEDGSDALGVVSADFARQLETELNEAKAELAEAVKRMEAVPLIELSSAWDKTDVRGVRARLISAAKGEP